VAVSRLGAYARPLAGTPGSFLDGEDGSLRALTPCTPEVSSSFPPCLWLQAAADAMAQTSPRTDHRGGVRGVIEFCLDIDVDTIGTYGVHTYADMNTGRGSYSVTTPCSLQPQRTVEDYTCTLYTDHYQNPSTHPTQQLMT
jgi:hypothetical protein